MKVTLIAAMARNGVIGDGPRIPWRLPDEQQMFKRVTMGHILVMGRKTYDSIGKPLPGRTTIVVTRQPDWRPQGADHVHVVHSIDEALKMAREIVRKARVDTDKNVEKEIFIAGGGQIYQETLEMADALILTEVDLEPSGDAFFPPYDKKNWREVDRHEGSGYHTIRYERVQ